jgi:hypothetical protein
LLTQSAELGYPVSIKLVKGIAYYMVCDIKGLCPPKKNMKGGFRAFFIQNNCETYVDDDCLQELNVRPKA